LKGQRVKGSRFRIGVRVKGKRVKGVKGLKGLKGLRVKGLKG
jgi:hypothetical protein